MGRVTVRWIGVAAGGARLISARSSGRSASLNPIAVRTRRRVEPCAKRLIFEIVRQRPGQIRRRGPGTLIKHLVRRIRRHWPHTRIVFRGDSHYARPEAMAWCEQNGVDYIFGLAGNRALHALAYEVADDLKVRRAKAGADRMSLIFIMPVLFIARPPSRSERAIDQAGAGENQHLGRPIGRLRAMAGQARSRASVTDGQMLRNRGQIP